MNCNEIWAVPQTLGVSFSFCLIIIHRLYSISVKIRFHCNVGVQLHHSTEHILFVYCIFREYQEVEAEVNTEESQKEINDGEKLMEEHEKNLDELSQKVWTCFLVIFII